MKLLNTVTSLQQAQKIAAQLKAKGILIFISNEDTKNLYPEVPYLGLVQVGVWVVLDYQYDDACALLVNPEHVVEQPLTSQEMFLMARDSKPPYSRTTRQILKLVAAIFITVVLMCVISYFLRTTYGR